MLSKLFKPGWQSSNAANRITAINKMNSLDETNQPIFEMLVKEDVDNGVRQAALNKLTKPAVIFEVSQAHPDAETRTHANTALATLIGAKSTLTIADFKQLIVAHPEMTIAVSQHCPYADLRVELLQTIPEAELATLISDIDYSETRQTIAQQLQTQEHLEHARRLLKGKDKNAEKIIKGKLDVLHAQQRLEHENQEAAENICAKMEYFATHEWRAEFKTQYSIWSQRWEALDLQPSYDVVQRYTQAKQKVASDVEREAIKEAAYQGQKNLMQGLEAYCNSIAQRSLETLFEQKLVLEEQLNKTLSEWQQHCNAAVPATNTAQRFMLGHNSLSTLAELLNNPSYSTLLGTLEQIDRPQKPTDAIQSLQASISNLDWPSQYPDLLAKNEATAKLSELKVENERIQKHAGEKLDKLHKRINRLLGTTKRGNIGQAKRELSAVIKASGKYTGKDKIALDDRLEKASEAVSKMGDWKDFATEPKYLALCEAMESLAESNTPADKLSAEINGLQKRWRALGYSDSSEQYWERFKAAGDKAYEPCAAFFKKRRDIQTQNLEKREPLILQMQELLKNTQWDEQPDYRQVETELQNIGNAWQKIKDVERTAGQKQWSRLSSLKSAVYEKLDLVYDANIELKNALVSQARALLETEIKEESIGKLQFLQSKWKQIGITRRKQDQAAWKQFKTATDNVYEKIQGLRHAKRADENEQLQSYRTIIKDINELAKSSTSLAEADTQFEKLQNDYQVLPALPKDLPEKLIERLDSDYRRASDTFNKARESIIESQHLAVLEALAQKAELCKELESCGSGVSAEALEQLNTKIRAIEINNKDLEQRFKLRFDAALEGDRTRANETRRLMCIDLEIILGLESPPEDAKLRTQIQLERMKKEGIGHGHIQKDSLVRELRITWLCSPGAEPELQKKLDQRFNKLQERSK